MNKYEIFDIRRGLLRGTDIVSADNPQEAVSSLGYTDVRRDYTGKYGCIVVTTLSGKGGNYVYYGVLAN